MGLRKLLLFLILFLLVNGAMAQETLKAARWIQPIPDLNQPRTHQGLLHFYKTYISSQDGESCSFYPSCSVFASQTLHQRNFFLSVFLISDRLSRCNGRQEGNYFMNDKGKQIDHP